MDVDLAVQMVGEESVSLGVMDHGDVIEVKEDVGDVPKSTEPKPWKVKKKPLNTFRAVSPSNDIEIYESKVAIVSARDFEVTPPETGYLCIRCQGDEEFYIPSHVVDCFQCVDIILHGDAVFKENLEKMIRFPDIRTEIMESILRFVFIEHLNNVKSEKYWGPDAPRLVFQFEVEPDQVMDLIQAAHFLGIKSLLNVAATMVAHHLADIPDVSSMVPDLAWCVAEQLTAQQLFDAEQRPDFLSLNLDTSVLWERHCKRLQVVDLVQPVSTSSYPSYDRWDMGEGPPSTSWKSLYVSLGLQQLADRQNGEKLDAFFAEVAYKGKFAYNHTIRGMMWDWVLSAPKSLSLASYARLFPNIFSLVLVKLPLDKPLADGALPCMSLGDILLNLPSLQHLDVSESGVTPDAAVSLSKGLKSHTRLQVLRIAYNNIQTRGFSAIATCLSTVKTLKILDARGNGIQLSVAQEVVAALEGSSLRELLLASNCTPFGSQMPHFQRTGQIRHIFTIRSTDFFHTNVEAEEVASGPAFILQAFLWSSLPNHLKRLQLAECQITDSQIATLIRALDNHETIEILELSDNQITSAGARAIFTWLQRNKSLRELQLGNNNITDSSSRDLIEALGPHPRLEKLSLKGNYSYGEENLRAVIQAAVRQGETLLLTQQKRFTLDLSSTDVSFITRARILQETTDLTEIYLFI
ncbi:hypothetical protein M758_1G321600 [Ceratodon purpureus]|nr:hypothetical protein M758_1G321600 [Ceratodon purpureus]